MHESDGNLATVTTAPLAELPANLTVGEFADRTRRCAESVLRMIRAGRIEARKIGRGYLIPRSELVRLELE